MSNDEWQLLLQFARAGSQPAFAELVSRCVRLVHANLTEPHVSALTPLLDSAIDQLGRSPGGADALF